MTVTRSELQAWLDTWNENHAAPSADSVVDFLGIELAPEPAPAPPVGQRRRSPDGAEVIKTDDGTATPWWSYRCLDSTWFTNTEVADWEVITDAPEVPDGVLNAAAQLIAADVCPCDDECDSGCIGTGDRLARILADAGLLAGTTPEAPKCDREHLPDGYVSVDFRAISSASLAWFVNVPSGRALLQIGDAARAELARRDES